MALSVLVSFLSFVTPVGRECYFVTELFEAELWKCVTLREEYRLKVFENRVLRRICGPKSEVTGGWRKLHNEALHGLYSSPSIVRVIKAMGWAGHVARMGEVRGAYNILVGRPEGRRPLGRPRRR
jgi:hypothetical protein